MWISESIFFILITIKNVLTCFEKPKPQPPICTIVQKQIFSLTGIQSDYFTMVHSEFRPGVTKYIVVVWKSIFGSMQRQTPTKKKQWCFHLPLSRARFLVLVRSLILAFTRERSLWERWRESGRFRVRERERGECESERSFFSAARALALWCESESERERSSARAKESARSRVRKRALSFACKSERERSLSRVQEQALVLECESERERSSARARESARSRSRALGDNLN